MRTRTARHLVIWCLAGAAALALATACGRLRAVEVTGDSMLPALKPGDWLLVRTGVRPEVGDIVVARHPDQRDLLIVKRADHRAGDGWWLESDNQRARGRRDSWDFGAVPDALILGRAIARYWPPPPTTFRPTFRTKKPARSN
ncbi:nickel-type superoxide dismutase maturation protease [Spirillospora sp. NBC_00431]